MTTLIKGGQVVSPSGALLADVLVDGETIAAVGAPGTLSGDETIDATGKYVLPGGIDAHTHMEMPFGGTHSVDTFSTGTTAAAWGGTTTIIDFAVQAKGTSLLSTMDKWHAKADGNCAIDYGFHMIVSDVNDQSLKEMEACVDAGVGSFKMFMAYPGVFYSTDGEILLAMQKAREIGATIMMHAENGIAIDQLAAQAVAAGNTDPVQHGLTRPPELEGEATSRAIQLAKVTGSPLYIVHLSASQALAAVAEARNDGQNVFAETCPQYLYLSIEDLAKPGFEGAKYVASPPLREKSPTPSCFWSLKQNGQWSVLTTERSLVRRPRHNDDWCSLGRNGGEATNFAPSKPGRARSSRDRKRYCGQVSAKTFCPVSRALVTSSSACAADRCTMYSGEPVTLARVIAREVASPSSSGGRVSPCSTGSVRPLASACATSWSIAMPFSACIMTIPPMSRAFCIARRISPSVA